MKTLDNEGKLIEIPMVKVKDGRVFASPDTINILSTDAIPYGIHNIEIKKKLVEFITKIEKSGNIEDFKIGDRYGIVTENFYYEFRQKNDSELDIAIVSQKIADSEKAHIEEMIKDFREGKPTTLSDQIRFKEMFLNTKKAFKESLSVQKEEKTKKRGLIVKNDDSDEIPCGICKKVFKGKDIVYLRANKFDDFDAIIEVNKICRGCYQEKIEPLFE